MIKLTKQSTPQTLIDNMEEWTKQLMDQIRKGLKVIYKYNHPSVKKAVMEDSYEKCIYCESKKPT